MASFTFKRHRPRGYVALLVCVCLLSGTVLADELEYRVKAAFLYNFSKFVDWPESALEGTDTFNICWAGGDFLRPILAVSYEGLSSKGRALDFMRVNGPGDLAQCHVLYLLTQDQAEVRRWLARVQGQPILTVGEASGFARAGGMIEFVIVEGKVRFDINHATVTRARLSMSSRLLSLARSVSR